MKVIRTIDVFPVDGEKLVEEIVVNDMNVDQVKGFYDWKSKNDPLFHDLYEVKDGPVSEYFSSEYGISFDFNRYIYYLCCSVSDEDF